MGSSGIRFRQNQDAGFPGAFPSFGQTQFGHFTYPCQVPDTGPESRVLYCKNPLGSRFRGNDGLLPKVDYSDFAQALPRLRLIWADGAWDGKLVQWAKTRQAAGPWSWYAVRHSNTPSLCCPAAGWWSAPRPGPARPMPTVEQRLRGAPRKRRSLGAYRHGQPHAQTAPSCLKSVVTHPLSAPPAHTDPGAAENAPIPKSAAKLR